jgi:cytochrome subunit of sulfide dehydrogenase
MQILHRTTGLNVPAQLALLALTVGLCLPGTSPAQSPNAAADALVLQSLAATCAQCHGTQGRALAGSSIAGLAGQKADYLAEQMKAFKTGSRPATVMHQISKGYSDAQIAQLANYFASQSAPAQGVPAPGAKP